MSCEVVQIPKEPDAAQIYLDQYKAFRLLALQQSPECFGSTYPREALFTDDIWLSRITNPIAATFVAIRLGVFVGTITILGPLSRGAEDGSLEDSSWEFDADAGRPCLCYRLVAMYTFPGARRQGIATELMGKALRYISSESEKEGRYLFVRLAVEKGNVAAQALYEKFGFLFLREEPLRQDENLKEVLILTYGPTKSVVCM